MTTHNKNNNNVTHDQKNSLRKVLLKNRDQTSADLIQIASKQIHNNLNKIPEFKKAQRIAFYYPIGSEAKIQDVIQESNNLGKQILFPRVEGDNLSFRIIKDYDDLEKGKFNIMEPRDNCSHADKIDVILIPAVGISRSGYRLGYGHGYYDRFLAKNPHILSIAITFEKQVVKHIPFDHNDVRVDWIVTEDRSSKVSK
jgi:5-formyltetrahydrofolate cyclo-ligase